MSERLLSVGLDVGTTSTQMIVSELTIENKAGSFTVPEMEIANRKILYRGQVHFTPLKGHALVDGEAVWELVRQEYALAGISREQVDTGAVIITGETSRKENAREVLSALSEFAGDFVVATAGPDLESKLAAKGAGAVTFSEETGKTVLHMDIGGGTSNLAWIRDGEIVSTGCLNVGGRLLKFDGQGKVLYVSPVLSGMCGLKVGEQAQREQVEAVAQMLVQVLEMAAGLREPSELLEKLWTKEITGPAFALAGNGREDRVVSFSGGVADCIETELPWLKFGDMGPLLGQAIRKSKLCCGEYRLGQETIRATVIGAGCHSAQLSGSTVFWRGVELPFQNLPVVRLNEKEQKQEDLALLIRERLRKQDTEAVLSLPGFLSPDYRGIQALARKIVQGTMGQRILVAMETDMAKALGQAMALITENPILCIDQVKLKEGDYLDVGKAVGSALPVVVKTLILTH